MKDLKGRDIHYMRISVTDRCNLRCQYCMPQDIQTVPMADILTYEEICAVVRIGVELGITDYRITGGEPLVRKQVAALVAMIKEIPGVNRVTMTTNGVVLKEYALALKQAGIDGINVSLDTAQREEYARITGRDVLPQVLAGVREAMDYNIPIKLNAVAGMTQDCEGLISLAQRFGLVLRFIEMMPIGYGRQFVKQEKVGMLYKLEGIYGKAVLLEKQDSFGTGPAEYYEFAGLSQPVGVIAALEKQFCYACNRVRLTAEGKLKPCLCYENGVDLRPFLRDKHKENCLKEVMKQCILNKPDAHCFLEAEAITEKNAMIQIGG